MHQTISLILLLLAIISTSATATPQEPMPAEISDVASKWLRHIRVKYRKIFSIRASLSQEMLSLTPPLTDSVHGILEVRRNSKIRISFKEPTEIRLVSNGTTTWLYDKKRRLAFEIPAKKTVWTTLFDHLLSNTDMKNFHISHIDTPNHPLTDDHAVLKFVPVKPDRFIASIVVTVQSKLPCIQRIMIVTHQKHIIRLTFDHVTHNVGIGAKRFDFDPPKRVKIITQ